MQRSNQTICHLSPVKTSLVDFPPGQFFIFIIFQGRNGSGSIFVFSAGNGRITGDSCAFNGYVNSIHTIAISAVNWDGSVPAYTERCASIMAVTYGQDMFPIENIVPPMVRLMLTLYIQTSNRNQTKGTVEC